MPSYLVESYGSESEARLADARARARLAAELGAGIRYVRTTYLPTDETLLHFFEAPSAAELDAAGRLARLRFERIVETIEGGAEPPEEGRR